MKNENENERNINLRISSGSITNKQAARDTKAADMVVGGREEIEVLDLSKAKSDDVPFSRRHSIAGSMPLLVLPRTLNSSAGNIPKSKKKEKEKEKERERRGSVPGSVPDSAREYIDRRKNTSQMMRTTFFSEMADGLRNLVDGFKILGDDEKHSIPQSTDESSSPAIRRYLDGWRDLDNLNLSGMRLVSLPNQILYSVSFRSNLRILNLSNNLIMELSKEICYMERLEELCLSDNNMTTLPSSIGLMLTLRKLDLRNNKLTELPKGVILLSNLQTLGLSRNNLRTLPYTLGRIASLQILDIQHNKKLERWFHKQGCTSTSSADVLNFLREYNERVHPFDAVRLVLLGSQGVGKTTLVERLHKIEVKKRKSKVGSPNIDHYLSKSTYPNAIESSILYIEPQSGSRIGKGPPTMFFVSEINSTELFGMHQFFLTDQTIYMILFDLRRPDEYDNVHLWLNSITGRKKDNCVVVLVGTHADDAQFGAATEIENTFSRIFSKMNGASRALVRYCIAVALSPNNDLYHSNIELLVKHLIELTSQSGRLGGSLSSCPQSADSVISTPHGSVSPRESNGRPVSPQRRWKKKTLGNPIVMHQKYLGLREHLLAIQESLGTPLISSDELQRVAKMCALEGEEYNKAVTTLRSLGLIICFDDESFLRGMVVLDGAWLATVLRSLIHAGAEHAKWGVIAPEDLTKVWRAAKFPKRIHGSLLELLEKLEVAFWLPSNLTPGTTSRIAGSFGYYRSGTSSPLSTGLFSSISLSSSSSSVPSSPKLSPLSSAMPSPRRISEPGGILVPCLIPDRHNFDTTYLAKRCTGSRGYVSRIYKFDHEFPSFFGRLMVRMMCVASKFQSWSILSYWKTGIDLLIDEKIVSLCLDVASKELLFSIQTPFQLEMQLLLFEAIETLLADWLQVNINVFVPCFSCIDKGAPDLHRFALYELETAAMAGKGDVFCPLDNLQQPQSLRILAPDVALAVVQTEECRQIEFSSIKLGAKLGSGSYSVVYRGTIASETYAVKQFTLPSDLVWFPQQIEESQRDVFQLFRKELRMMNNINHKNIIRVEAFSLKPLAIVMEFMELGSLYDYLRDKTRTIDLAFQLCVAMDVAAGMSFLHNHKPPIVHRDLKSPNILLTKSQGRIVAKISDFGTSRSMMLVPGLNSNTVDNPTWLAPEVLMQKLHTEKADVYSYGVILYELLSQKGYFADKAFMWALSEAVIRGERPKIPENANQLLADLTENCWISDPEKRPNFSEIFQQLSIIKLATGIQFDPPAKLEEDEDTESDGIYDEEYDEDIDRVGEGSRSLSVSQLEMMIASKPCPAPSAPPAISSPSDSPEVVLQRIESLQSIFAKRYKAPDLSVDLSKLKMLSSNKLSPEPSPTTDNVLSANEKNTQPHLSHNN